MTFFNETPLAAEIFEQLNMQGRMNGVVAVRGTFAAVPDRRLRLCEEQAPFVWEDTYAGDPLTTPLLVSTDLVPFKPGTDITFRGHSFAPGGQPQARWQCSLEVERRFKKVLQVTGPREWRPRYRTSIGKAFGLATEPTFVGWTLEEPEPARETPVCWSQAFGGSWPSSTDPSGSVHHADNWIGSGWLDPQGAPRNAPWPAPRIEDPDDPIVDWQRLDYVPQGLAPMPPFWEVRRRHAGTMDEAWLEQRHPLPPRDFDFKFWQVASPGCIAEPWLQGHEVINLTNLHREHAELRVALPGLEMHVRLARDGAPSESFPVVLDGVHFDFTEAENRVFVTWRCGFPWPDGRGDVHLERGADGRR